LGGTSPSANRSLTSCAEAIETLREKAVVWRAGDRANGSNVTSSFSAETGLGLPSVSALRSSESSLLKRNVGQIQVRATRGIDARRSDDTEADWAKVTSVDPTEARNMEGFDALDSRVDPIVSRPESPGWIRGRGSADNRTGEFRQRGADAICRASSLERCPDCLAITLI
jgi:hypothetical protein